MGWACVGPGRLIAAGDILRGFSVLVYPYLKTAKFDNGYPWRQVDYPLTQRSEWYSTAFG